MGAPNPVAVLIKSRLLMSLFICCHFPASLQLVLEYLSALHHELDSLKFGNVGYRIARDSNHVGELASIKRADAILPSHEGRSPHGCRANCLRRSHPELHHVGEFFRLTSMQKWASTRAKRNLHSRRHRLREAAFGDFCYAVPAKSLLVVLSIQLIVIESWQK